MDDKFVSLLESLFGIPTVKNFRSSYPAEWLRMMNDFEMKKRSRRAFDGKSTRIILPRDFARLVSDPKCAGLSESLERFCIHQDVEIYNGEYLSLGPNAMKQLFEPVVTGIASHRIFHSFVTSTTRSLGSTLNRRINNTHCSTKIVIGSFHTFGISLLIVSS